MHSNSNNISNQRIQRRRCFAHKRRSCLHSFPCACRDRNTMADISAAWQGHTDVPEAKQDGGCFLPPGFLLPESRTLENHEEKYPKSWSIRIVLLVFFLSFSILLVPFHTVLLLWTAQVTPLCCAHAQLGLSSSNLCLLWLLQVHDSWESNFGAALVCICRVLEE